MPSRTLLALALALASGLAMAATYKECMVDCDNIYKSCVSSGRGSEQGCRVAHEKCRKECNKKTQQQN